MSRTISRSASSSHSAHIWGSERGSRARCALPYIWTAHGALGRARCTVHPQAVTAGDGTRGTRPSPHLDGLYADALRRDTRSRCSPQAYRRAVELGPEGLGRAAATGAQGSARHGSARSGGTQSVGQHGTDPGETICRFALCLPAIRWPIYRCVAEQSPDSQCALMANRQTAGL